MVARFWQVRCRERPPWRSIYSGTARSPFPTGMFVALPESRKVILMNPSLQRPVSISAAAWRSLLAGLGLLGQQHAEAIAAAGGTPVLVDMRAGPARKRLFQRLPGSNVSGRPFQARSRPIFATPSGPTALSRQGARRSKAGVDILINNAANNPKMETPADLANARLENFPLAHSARFGGGADGGLPVPPGLRQRKWPAVKAA